MYEKFYIYQNMFQKKRAELGVNVKIRQLHFPAFGRTTIGVVRMGGTLSNVLWLIVLRGVYRRTTFLSCILIFHLLDNIYIYTYMYIYILSGSSFKYDVL